MHKSCIVGSWIVGSCVVYYLPILSDTRHFPSQWTKANVAPIHKKKKKKKKWQTCVKNYLPISLLQICNEVLNHVIYNAMFSYFLKNNLISEIQSGFKPSHSCINQLLSISQSLFSSFDENCQVRGNSLTFVARWNYS